MIRSWLHVFLGFSLILALSACEDETVNTDPGTGDIQGTITLGDGAEPSGVTITAAGQSVTTESDGAYLLSGLPSGTHLLRASQIGYTPFEQDVTVSAGSAVTVDITLQRRGPRIESLAIAPELVVPNGTATATATVTAPEGSTLTYNWSIEPSSFTIAATSEGEATIMAPGTPDVEATVTLEVVDDAGTSDTLTATVATTANGAPIISSVTANPPTVSPGGTSTLRVIASDPDGDTLQYSWTAPSGWTIDGSGDTVTLNAPESPDETATITVEVSDALTATTSEIVVSTNSNSAPSIASLTAQPPSVAPGGAITLSVSANDPEGDQLQYTWSSPAEWPISPNGSTAGVTAPASYSQSGQVEVTVTDTFGGSATANITLTTVDNQAPTISSLIAVPSTVKPGLDIALSATATDALGDELTYAWSVDDPNWTLSGSGASVTLTATTVKDDSAIVTLVVSDPDGAEAQDAVSVLTNANCSLPDGLIDGGPTACYRCGTDAILADSPLLLWPLDDSGATAADATANGRDGTFGGNETLGAPSVNHTGSAATLFNRATDSNVQLDSTDWWPSDAISATFWIRGTAPNQASGLISYAVSGANNNAFLIFHEGNANGLTVHINGSSAITGVDVMDGQWHHVAATWQSSDGALALYVDGASAFTATHQAGVTMEAGGALFLAQDQDNRGGALDGNQAFSGALANVALFDAALTPAQIDRQMRGATCEEVCDGADNDGDGDADEGYAGACADNPVTSCKAALDAGLGLNDGIHWINPLSDSGGVQAWCDMSTDGGGWTLAMRTRWSWSESSALRSDYATFYNDYLGGPHPSRGHRLPGEFWPALQSSNDHLARYVIRATDGSSCAPLGYVIDGGVWDVPAGGGATISGYTQPVSTFNTGNFSTTDNGPSTNCVVSNNGAAWTYGACCSTCPTYQGSYWTDEPHPMVSVSNLDSKADVNGTTPADACAGKTPQLSNGGTGGYYGMNTWEYYIR